MARLIMNRKASDNVYLHKDFHNALNISLEYLRGRFRENAPRQYLRQFAGSFYAPLTRQLRRHGLGAMKKHLQRVYSIEKGAIRIHCSRNELRLETGFCPAVKHIRKLGFPVSPLFIETERAVYAAICEGTPYESELSFYDPKTGRSIQRFYSASQPKALLRRSSVWLHRRKK